MQDAPWLAKAKTLAAGQSTRIICCSDDRSMLISNNRRGYTGYCFRCGPPGVFEPHGQFSIAMLAQRKAELELVQSKEVKLPNDFTLDVPQSDAVWFYKAGISAELARKYSIGYSKYLGRVILPVFNGDELLAYTARARFGKPKYIEKSVDPSGCVFIAYPETILPSYRDWSESTGPATVFVEDNLSAIRVGCVARHVVSLMGTSANDRQLMASGLQFNKAESTASDVVIWLDSDAAGRRASTELSKALRLRGCKVREVSTARDPKFYSNQEIQRILQG